MRRILIAPVSVVALVAPALVSAEPPWVILTDETSVRLPVPPNVAGTSIDDTSEKDYAWGDVDLDGDTDLLVARKEAYTFDPGTNVLFLNEGTAEGHAIDGVLVDRTAEYCHGSDVPGDLGFGTPTNDRDIALADLNDDGWPDIVTAPAWNDGQPRHISHPRVYINLGERDGVWLGFRYELNRIPLLHPSEAPRFASVSVGDLTGDDAPDLYFTDFDNSESPFSTPTFDFDNRLLVNDGSGFFTDQTAALLTMQMSDSAYGAASVIADMNGDRINDIVKQSSNLNPLHIAITYNSAPVAGSFHTYDVVYSTAAYFVSTGDLNNDGRLDLVVTDNGADRYMLNQGNNENDVAQFVTRQFPTGPSNGFGGNSIVADLDDDGFGDVLITDMDVDVPGCGRRMHIYHNEANAPNVTFDEEGQVISGSLLSGTHDVAVFDIDGNGLLDLVIGRCFDTRVWMNQPRVEFAYPGGLPTVIDAGAAFDLPVTITPPSAWSVVPGSPELHLSVNDGPVTTTPLTPTGGDAYVAPLPAGACLDRYAFHLSVELDDGAGSTDPLAAPESVNELNVADDAAIVVDDDFESGAAGWSVSSQTISAGEWEAVDPIGTTAAGGDASAPEDDATDDGVIAFVTENGPLIGGPSFADVDGGPTRLISPPLDLTDVDANVAYSRWFFCDDAGGAQGDTLDVEVSNDGGSSWHPVPGHSIQGTGGVWERASFRVGDVVTPTADVRIRFVTSDNPNDSLTEAGIDDVRVETLACNPTCFGDIASPSGIVDVDDLVEVIVSWGPCDGCPADLDGSGVVDVDDLVELILAWGDC